LQKEKGERAMKKTFQLEELDCANCAAKMETAISNMPEVNSVSINFMAQKMVIDIDDDKFDATMKKVQKTIAKVEPDCTIIM